MLHRLRWQNELDGIGEQYERSRRAIARSCSEGSLKEPSPRSGASRQPSGAWLRHRARFAIASQGTSKE
jgi:hypothetical protein